MPDSHLNPPVVFIHLPRTGGTTFHRLLEKQYARGESLRLHSLAELDTFKRLPDAEKNRYRFIHGHIGSEFLAALGHGYQYVTFLREPLSRVASSYQFIRKTPTHTHHDTVTQRNLSLVEFITAQISVSNIDNGMTRSLCGEPNNARSVAFGHCTKEMLNAAQKNLQEHIAVVGLTEEYDASLVLMRRRFGWNSPLYSIQNTTKSASVEEKLTEKEIAAIQEHNALDLELYRFARTLFLKQVLRALPFFPFQVRHFRNKNLAHKQDPEAYKRLRQFEYKRIARWMDLK
jgi:hypothetical protein